MNIPRKPIELTIIVLFLLVSICVVQAQSGRRQTRASAVATPTPTPEPTPTPKVQPKSELGFFVGMDTRDTFANIPLSFYDTVLSSCVARLGKMSSATVTMAPHELNRGEAAKKAKGETKTYVVWLQLNRDTMNSSSSNSYDQIQIEYAVYAPGTGKIVTSGRSYQNANRKGPIIVGPTGGASNNAIYRDGLLRVAAEDAADRILRALNLISGTTNLASQKER